MPRQYVFSVIFIASISFFNNVETVYAPEAFVFQQRK